MIPTEWLIAFSLILFAFGWIAILVRRNVIVMLMGVQWLFVSVALAFVSFARSYAHEGAVWEGAVGESAAVLVLAIAIIHLVVGLSVTLSQKHVGVSSDVDDASDLRW